MNLTPICYHVPIVCGHSGEYYTYYIVKGSPRYKHPIETEYYGKVEEYGLNEPVFNKWFVVLHENERVSRHICERSESIHHEICPLPEQRYGFDTPEEALEALMFYFEKTGKTYRENNFS